MPRFNPTIVHMANATQVPRLRQRKVAIFLWGMAAGWLSLIIIIFLTRGTP